MESDMGRTFEAWNGGGLEPQRKAAIGSVPGPAMRKLYSDGHDDADWLIAGLMRLGYALERGDKVLDYGCGAGNSVYAFRARGFDAFGFDIHNYVKLRAPEDARFFNFMDNPITDTSDTTFDPARLKIGFPDDTFDLVFSSTTLEHVMDMTPVMAEIARVLKPDGIAVHFYPDKSVLIEPHILVPLASRIQSWWWFYVWAMLGVRNQYQRHMSARETADNNARYCRSGLNYRTAQELLLAVCPYFSVGWIATDEFHGRDWNKWSRVRSALRSGDAWAQLAVVRRQTCLFTTGKIGAPTRPQM
jgi:SAM-dependent methyltransferase